MGKPSGCLSTQRQSCHSNLAVVKRTLRHSVFPQSVTAVNNSSNLFRMLKREKKNIGWVWHRSEHFVGVIISPITSVFHYRKDWEKTLVGSSVGQSTFPALSSFSVFNITTLDNRQHWCSWKLTKTLTEFSVTFSLKYSTLTSYRFSTPRYSTAWMWMFFLRQQKLGLRLALTLLENK